MLKRWYILGLLLLVFLAVIYKPKSRADFYTDRRLEIARLIPRSQPKPPVGLKELLPKSPPRKLLPPTTDQAILEFAKYYYDTHPPGSLMPYYTGLSRQECFAIDIVVEYERWLKIKEVEK